MGTGKKFFRDFLVCVEKSGNVERECEKVKRERKKVGNDDRIILIL
jgi:hypothetical protein